MAAPKGKRSKRTTYIVVGVIAVAAAYLYWRRKKSQEAQAQAQQTGQLVAIEPEGAGGGAGRGGAALGEQGLPGEVGPAGPTGSITPEAEEALSRGQVAAGAAGSAAGASAASAAGAAAAAAQVQNTAAAIAIQSAGIINASRAYQNAVQTAPHPSPQAVRGGGTAYPLPVIIGSAVTAAEASHGVVAKETMHASPPGFQPTFVRIGAPIYAPPGTPAMPPAPPPPPPPAVANYWAEQKALHPGSW